MLVGYHSTGGYKLFDPVNKKIVINRDMIIDELKEWDCIKEESNYHEYGLKYVERQEFT